MKVLFDSRWLGPTGIGRYTQEIISRTPVDVDLVGVGQMSYNNPLTPLKLGIDILKYKPEKFWSPSFMPPITKIPYVFTIHDLIHLHFHSNFHKNYYKYVIGPLAQGASKIITVSSYSADEISRRLSLPRNKIEVSYLGVEPSFTCSGSKLDLGRPYFLYIGNRRKHKNIRRIIEAFSLFCESNADYVIALSGVCDSTLIEYAKNLNIDQRVIFLGHILEERLPDVYRGARATVFTSLYEGFGLPIIESMACGTPVITSNISSMPEVSGGASYLVDPYSVSSIASAMEDIALHNYIHDDLVEMGLRNSSRFKWKDTADVVWETIKNA